jgi:hypothetical protein
MEGDSFETYWGIRYITNNEVKILVTYQRIKLLSIRLNGPTTIIEYSFLIMALIQRGTSSSPRIVRIVQCIIPWIQGFEGVFFHVKMDLNTPMDAMENIVVLCLEGSKKEFVSLCIIP